jgi:hypothetical protein
MKGLALKTHTCFFDQGAGKRRRVSMQKVPVGVVLLPRQAITQRLRFGSNP